VGQKSELLILSERAYKTEKIGVTLTNSNNYRVRERIGLRGVKRRRGEGRKGVRPLP